MFLDRYFNHVQKINRQKYTGRKIKQIDKQKYRKTEKIIYIDITAELINFQINKFNIKIMLKILLFPISPKEFMLVCISEISLE